jgi:hypothetical protein
MQGLWPFLVSVILVFAALTVVWFEACRSFGWVGFAVGFICITVLWLLVELMAGLIFYTYAEIVCDSKRKDG